MRKRIASSKKTKQDSFLQRHFYGLIKTSTVFTRVQVDLLELKKRSKKSPSTYTWVKNWDQKSSGQISITIVSNVNKHPLLHSTSYDVISLIEQQIKQFTSKYFKNYLLT